MYPAKEEFIKVEVQSESIDFDDPTYIGTLKKKLFYNKFLTGFYKKIFNIYKLIAFDIESS